MVSAVSLNHSQTISPGPLIDDGSHYSGLGIFELRSLLEKQKIELVPKLDSIPEVLISRPYWQYGIGNHRSNVPSTVMKSRRWRDSEEYGAMTTPCIFLQYSLFAMGCIGGNGLQK